MSSYSPLLDTPDEMAMFPTSIRPTSKNTSNNNSEPDRDLLFTPQVLQRRMSQMNREGQRAPAAGGSVTAYAFTLNYIFGAGVLSLPFTIAKAGVIASAVFMVFTALISSMTMIWLTEVCGRAEGLTRHKEERELESTSNSPVRTEFIADRPENRGIQLFRISSRRLEINQISTLILGYWPGIVYSVSIFCYGVGSMWFYAVIFARSLTETLPLSLFVKEGDHCDLSMPLHLSSTECHNTYTLYLGIFLSLTMFASLFELAEQKKLQTGLSILAVSCICVMITSLIVEAVQHPYVVNTLPSPSPSSPSASSLYTPSPSSNASNASNASAVLATAVHAAAGAASNLLQQHEPPVIGISIKDFGGAFMNFVFAFMAHGGVPGLVQLMDKKEQAPKTFIGAMLTACLIYLTLGTVAALFFGLGPDGIKSLITLDWYNYNGSNDPAFAGNIFTKGLSYLVRLYPCVSVTSAYVLYADLLASSMRVLIFDKPDRQLIKVGSRWFMIWLTIALAAVMIKIDVIVGICGLFGINLVMIFPALLQMYSKKQCDALFGRSTTPFSCHFSDNAYAYFMLLFAVGTSGLGVYSLVETIRNSGGGGSVSPSTVGM